MLNGFDLQLFAEEDFEEEVEDEGYVGDDEEELDEEPTGDDEKEEETVDDEKPTEEPSKEDDESSENSELDSKTKAIIREKKKRKEAEERLEKLEAEMAEKQEKKELDKRIDQKIEKGYSEDEAKRMAEIELEREKLQSQVMDFKFKELENKYPLISNYREKIESYQEKLPDATLEEIYLAKFYNESKADSDRIAQQRVLNANQEAQEKQMEKGEERGMESDNVKLSPSDQRAYEALKETRPDMTKKKFKQLLETEEIIEV